MYRFRHEEFEVPFDSVEANEVCKLNEFIQFIKIWFEQVNVLDTYRHKWFVLFVCHLCIPHS